MARSRGPERPCDHCGEPFRPVHGATAGRYCSRACYYAAKPTHTQPVEQPCPQCGTRFTPAPAYRPTQVRYCSPGCAAAGMRKPVETFICRQCGKERPRPPGPKGLRQFLCGLDCSALYRRKGPALTCPQCRQPFRRKPSAIANGAGHYCSVTCRGLAQRRPVEKTCARCQRTFTTTPFWLEHGRKYCSWACHVGPDGGGREIACQLCGKPRRVSAWHLRHGHGKYCSRSCFGEAKRLPRQSLTCARDGCDNRFEVRPRQVAQRKYCSLRCTGLVYAPRRSRCQRCRVTFSAPTWRKRRFCSPACAHHGRNREPRPELVARNARILELDAEGCTAPAIQERLAEANPEWWASPATIYQVVSQARRQAAGR